jgi:hypothetical protein
MGTFNFSNLPGFQEALTRIEEGALNGNDGPQFTNVPWDFTKEYRVEVVQGDALRAGSGTEGFLMVLEVTNEGPHKGQRIWYRNYIKNDPPAFIVSRLATIASAFPDGPPMGDVSWDVFAAKSVGATYVIGLQEGNSRTEGDDTKYPEIRWINRDMGQTLQTNIKPPKPRSESKGLTATVIPGLTDAAPAATAAPAAAPAPVVEAAPAPTPVAEVVAPDPAPVEVVAQPTAPVESGVRPAGIRLPGM